MKALFYICILALGFAIFSVKSVAVTKIESGCGRCQQITNIKAFSLIFFARADAISIHQSNPKELTDNLNLCRQLLFLINQAENCSSQSLEALRYIFIKVQTIMEIMQSVTSNKIDISPSIYANMAKSLQTAAETSSDAILKNQIDMAKLKEDFESDGIKEYLDVSRKSLNEKSEEAVKAFDDLISDIEIVINAIGRNGKIGCKETLENVAASGMTYVGIAKVMISNVDQNKWPKAVALLNTVIDILNKVYTTFGKSNYQKSALPVLQRLVGSISQILYTMNYQFSYGSTTSARIDDLSLDLQKVSEDVNSLAENVNKLSTTAGNIYLEKLQGDLILLDDTPYLANTVDLLRTQKKTLDINFLLQMTEFTKSFVCVVGVQSSCCK